MKQNAIDIVKKFIPYAKGANNEFEFQNAVECAKVFIVNAKVICPYIRRADRDSSAELKAPNYQFVDFWIEIESELNNLTLDDIK